MHVLYHTEMNVTHTLQSFLIEHPYSCYSEISPFIVTCN